MNFNSLEFMSNPFMSSIRGDDKVVTGVTVGSANFCPTDITPQPYLYAEPTQHVGERWAPALTRPTTLPFSPSDYAKASPEEMSGGGGGGGGFFPGMGMPGMGMPGMGMPGMGMPGMGMPGVSPLQMYQKWIENNPAIQFHKKYQRVDEPTFIRNYTDNPNLGKLAQFEGSQPGTPPPPTLAVMNSQNLPDTKPVEVNMNYRF